MKLARKIVRKRKTQDTTPDEPVYSIQVPDVTKTLDDIEACLTENEI